MGEVKGGLRATFVTPWYGDKVPGGAEAEARRTAQNLANLEADLKAWVPALAEKDEAAITRRLEMLVRAYDPCISCATH